MTLAIDKFDPRRFGLITGSACHVLFPEKGNGIAGQKTYARKLATQKYFRTYDEVSTWQIEHGEMNEHAALEYFQTHYDFAIDKGFFICEGEYGATCDAIADFYGVDFKCPTSLDGFIDYLMNGIDKQQFYQAQFYMRMFGKDLWKMAIYLTETSWMIDREISYPVSEDKRMIIIDVPKQEGWSEMLIENSRFVIEERDKYFNILCEQFGSKEEDKDYQKIVEEIKVLKKKLNI